MESAPLTTAFCLPAFARQNSAPKGLARYHKQIAFQSLVIYRRENLIGLGSNFTENSLTSCTHGPNSSMNILLNRLTSFSQCFLTRLRRVRQWYTHSLSQV